MIVALFSFSLQIHVLHNSTEIIGLLIWPNIQYNIWHFLNAANLVYITTQNDTFYVDKSVAGGHKYYYVITALDRVNNESPPSNQIAVAIPQHVLSDRMKAINSE